MRTGLSRLVLAVALVCLASPLAFAQGSAKAALSGVVVDTGGGVIPGATVVVKNVATGVATEIVTNGSGAFSVPALDPGKYDVTVTLQGFKTAKNTDVVLNPGGSSSITVKMEVGSMTDTVQVVAHTELVETASTTVSSTISADVINNSPLVTKNALNFVTFLPGVNSGSGSHSQRASTVMGLPQASIAVSIDGVNVQDQLIKSTDGFFANISPQTDLVDEVTVSDATPSADASGQGAVQIKFVTRSGSNTPSGSAYEYLRHPDLNSNSWANINVAHLPKNVVIVNQYGFREGGPVVIPGLYDGRGKAFYFFNYEEFRQPANQTVNREILSATAQTGVFQYGCTAAGCAHSVNLLALGAANGQTSAINTQMAYILGQINNSTKISGTVINNTDLNTQLFSWQPLSLGVRHLPGGSFDYNLNNNEKIKATYDFQKVNSNPDLLNSRSSDFPGQLVHGAQYSFRNKGSASLRSTLTKNMVNEASWGFLWSPVYFFGDLSAADFADQGGFNVAMNFNIGGNVLTNYQNSSNQQARNGSNYNVNDTLTWLKGKHSFTMGENFSQAKVWNNNQNLTPGISMGLDTTNDPAAAIAIAETAMRHLAANEGA